VRFWLLLVAACHASHGGTVDANEHTDAPVVPETYRSAVLADRPLAYWRLSDTNVKDEVAGYDGALVGGCTATASALIGDADPALHFDGTCKIVFPDHFGFAGMAPFAIELWVSSATNQLFQQVFGRETRDAIDPIEGYALFVSPTPGGFSLERVIGAASKKAPVVPFSAGAFTYVVAQYTGTTLEVYLDGTLASSAAESRAAADVTATAISGSSVAGNSFTGSVDELAVYDKALTIDQIGHHYALGLGH
jgi:trimeric autotransporter adhesin